MLELPEANTLANQLNETVRGKGILNVTAGFTPHKLTWYYGDPAAYHELLSGQTIDGAAASGGFAELLIGDCRLTVQDGINLRFYAAGEALPKKHQLLIEFEDFSCLAATVQMYGGICAFRSGENDNPYYLVAKEKPSPLSEEFNEEYFEGLFKEDKAEKLSAKAFLATGQRIPGLGNGVLQDILWKAKIHPKRKMGSLKDTELHAMYHAVKDLLQEMTIKGGRDTERDLFGCLGGYHTILSKNTASIPCPACGGEIIKEAYLGGSVYYCPVCQPIS